MSTSVPLWKIYNDDTEKTNVLYVGRGKKPAVALHKMAHRIYKEMISKEKNFKGVSMNVIISKVSEPVGIGYTVQCNKIDPYEKTISRENGESIKITIDNKVSVKRNGNNYLVVHNQDKIIPIGAYNYKKLRKHIRDKTFNMDEMLALINKERKTEKLEVSKTSPKINASSSSSKVSPPKQKLSPSKSVSTPSKLKVSPPKPTVSSPKQKVSPPISKPKVSPPKSTNSKVSPPKPTTKTQAKADTSKLSPPKSSLVALPTKPANVKTSPVKPILKKQTK